MIKIIKNLSHHPASYLIIGSWNLISALISFSQKNHNLIIINQLNSNSFLNPIDQIALEELNQVTIMQNKFSIINLIIASCFYTISALKIIKKNQHLSPPRQIYQFLSKKINK